MDENRSANSALWLSIYELKNEIAACEFRQRFITLRTQETTAPEEVALERATCFVAVLSWFNEFDRNRPDVPLSCS